MCKQDRVEKHNNSEGGRDAELEMGKSTLPAPFAYAQRIQGFNGLPRRMSDWGWGGGHGHAKSPAAGMEHAGGEKGFCIISLKRSRSCFRNEAIVHASAPLQAGPKRWSEIRKGAGFGLSGLCRSGYA